MTPEQLATLWQAYREDKKPSLAPTTYGREYGAILKRIAKMPPGMETGKDYRAYLLETYSPETAKRTLQAIAACTRWAIAEGHAKTDPFHGIKIITPKKPVEFPEAFTASEMGVIIDRFNQDHPYYLPWVKWLFWTGCRPEEARAISWGKIAGDWSSVRIDQAWPLEASKPQRTKNGRTTKFPLSPRLTTLLKDIRPHDAAPSDWVFMSWTGQAFNYSNFERRQWRPTLEQLLAEGAIAYYGPQYWARHTAVSLMLKAGLSVEDVAYLTRTSRKIIWDHYAAKSRQINIPEF